MPIDPTRKQPQVGENYYDVFRKEALPTRIADYFLVVGYGSSLQPAVETLARLYVGGNYIIFFLIILWLFISPRPDECEEDRDMDLHDVLESETALDYFLHFAEHEKSDDNIVRTKMMIMLN